MRSFIKLCIKCVRQAEVMLAGILFKPNFSASKSSGDSWLSLRTKNFISCCMIPQKNVSLCNRKWLFTNTRNRIIITYKIFDVLIRFFKEKFETYVYAYVYERNSLYFCFKINCSPHDFIFGQPLNIVPLHINTHIALNSHINMCVVSRITFPFDTFWRSIRQEVTNFRDLNLSCETNSSLASQNFSRYFGIHTIHNRVLKSHKLATIGTKI